MKKYTHTLLACLALVACTAAWATPDTEAIGTREQGINGPVFLITDSVTAVEKMPNFYTAVLVINTNNTITSDRAITVNCNDRSLRHDWTAGTPGLAPFPLSSIRTQESSKFEAPAPDSLEALLVTRVCDQQ